MRLRSLNWLKSPADREIIRRWTAGGPEAAYELDLPQPADPDCFEFLVLGDTGDSEPGQSGTSPQDAVARFLTEDAGPPVGKGKAELVLHLGDVVYMTGERRLYDPNFRRPYAGFLTPESTVEDIVFRMPFLPVPGNHDYYDFARWARVLTRVPVLGGGVRAIAQELFAYRIPEGGSGKGRAYMEAFVDGAGAEEPLPYRPGERTRLPNRYYRFRFGCADFFGLDSNTLEPPPPSIHPVQVRREARERVRALEEHAGAVDRQLRRDEAALERWLGRKVRDAARDPAVLPKVADASGSVLRALRQLGETLGACGEPACRRALQSIEAAAAPWSGLAAELRDGRGPAEAHQALTGLTDACGGVERALKRVEECLAALPEGPRRAAALSYLEGAAAALKSWRDTLYGPLPAPLCSRIRSLSESALDVQRELARERLRTRYRPEDFDRAQIDWLDRALSLSERERPAAWRIVFLHHPLYTTIGNHCEHADVQGVRENLLPLLRKRVDLVLTGHSHAFEWMRSQWLPNTGIFVSGGGGQVSLRRSVLDPERFPRAKARYQSLLQAGALESACAGRGPDGADGVRGSLYHYLRVRVSRDRIEVMPVGVRRVGRGVYRLEEPLPVYHVPELGPVSEGVPRREVRLLEAVELRRGQPPRPRWR